MPVNARAFVEPAVAEAGVHANNNRIAAAVVQEIGDIELEGRVTVIISADKTSIHEH